MRRGGEEEWRSGGVGEWGSGGVEEWRRRGEEEWWRDGEMGRTSAAPNSLARVGELFVQIFQQSRVVSAIERKESDGSLDTSRCDSRSPVVVYARDCFRFGLVNVDEDASIFFERVREGWLVDGYAQTALPVCDCLREYFVELSYGHKI